MDAGALEAEADALCAAVSGASDVKSRLAAAEELAAWLERLPQPHHGHRWPPVIWPLDYRSGLHPLPLLPFFTTFSIVL